MRRSSEVLRIERLEGPTAVLTLHRPHRRNAVDDQLHSELATVFTELRTEQDLRAIVLTGADRWFCVGGDTDPAREFRTRSGLTPIQEARLIVDSMLECEKPIVAAVNGDAFGLGALLTTLADTAVMAAGARIGDAHVAGGLPAGNGPAALWPMLIGVQAAKRLLMGAEVVTAESALELGLVQEVVPAADVLPRALAIAASWAALDPFAVQATKASINEHVRAAVARVLPLSLALEEQAMQRPDFRARLFDRD